MTDQPLKPYPMTNTHILTGEFDYYEPATLAEALDVYQNAGPNARLIAGGTHLVTMLKMEREAPAAVISLQRVPGLTQVELSPAGWLKIGACATIRAVRNDRRIQARYPALAESCAAFGSTQVQIMGTIGGNLCNGSPASDSLPALLIYDAVVEIHSHSGTRRLPLQEFLLGPGKTALKGGEILTAVHLPPPPDGAHSTFQKISRVSADLAKASAAMLIVRAGSRITECRMAFGSVAPTAIRVPAAEALLAGQEFSDSLLEKAAGLVARAVSPIDDVRSAAWYRRELAGVMCRDVFHLLWDGKSAAPAGLGRFAEVQVEAPQKADSLQVLKGEQIPVSLVVNGQAKQIYVQSNTLLLNVLREGLELTGAKYGCGLGECSACTVLVDGQPQLACLTLAAAVDGREIDTVEGLEQRDGTLDPLQEAFIAESAYQCGYCTPGFITTLKGLFREVPAPDEDEIRDYLKGNRCRCTGYVSIVKAVNRCVEKLQELEPAG